MSYLQLLRRPAPLLLWVSQLISSTGERLYGMALLWLAYEVTGSVSLMALLSLSETVPAFLTGLVASGLIGRWVLPSIVRVNLMRGALVLALPVAWGAGVLHPWMLVAVAAGLGSLGALLRPALRAAVPGLVRVGELQAMYGLLDTTGRLARMLGPGMAGTLLVYMSQIHLFTLNGVSFLLSALCLAFLARPTPPVRATRHRGSPTGGWALVAQDRSLTVALAVRGLCNVAWAVFTLGVPLLTAARLNSGAEGYGLLLAAYGGGNLAGNLYIGNTQQATQLVRRYLSGWMLIGVGFILIGTAPTLTWAMAAMAFAGLFGPTAHIPLDAYLGQTYEADNLAKIYSLQEAILNLAAIAGMPLAALILKSIPAHLAISGAGVWILLTATVAALLLRQTSLFHLSKSL